LITNHFLILGIGENAGDVEIEDAYRYLSSNLSAPQISAEAKLKAQADKCLKQVEKAYQFLQNPNKRTGLRGDLEHQRSQDPEVEQVLLGHLCVAAGIISLEDLNDAVKRQNKIDLPLGQLLQEKKLLSQTELDGLLMGQGLYTRSQRPMDDLTERLLFLEVINLDMVKIALIDQRSNMKPLPELLIERGWLSPKLVEVLQSQTTASGTR
jgi:hypothetical protein